MGAGESTRYISLINIWDRHLNRRAIFKQKHSVALAEWRQPELSGSGPPVETGLHPAEETDSSRCCIFA
jgi:hypothetical protein